MVYLLHFNTRYKHAGHYIGFADHDLDARIAEHRAGRGARLMQVLKGAGTDFVVARTWQGDRKLERRIKKCGGAARICPVCNPKAMSRAVFTR